MNSRTELPMVRSRRLILRHAGPVDIHRMAAEYLWTLVENQPGDPDRKVSEVWVWEIAPGLSMHYFHDFVTGQEGVVFFGDGPGEVNRFALLARARLDLWEDQDLLDSVDLDGDRDSAMTSLFRLGLGAPLAQDPQFLAVIQAAMTHHDPLIRRGGVWAAGFAAWPGLVEALRELAERDPDGQVRADADQARSAIESSQGRAR